MFVQDFKVVDQPYDDVAFRLADGIEKVLEAGINPARAEGERLSTKVAPRGWPTALAKTVEISAGPVREFGESMFVGFSWDTPGKGSLFPRLEADIEVAPFGLDQTVVAIRGSYEPPGGAFGAEADRLLIRHLAESTIRAFLDGLCTSLERGTAQRN